jgi:hypothetical protein
MLDYHGSIEFSRVDAHAAGLECCNSFGRLLSAP